MNNSKKLVIAINGIATSGKDELVTQICNKFNCPKIRIANISSVDDVKVVAMERFGWDGVKDERGRNLLSALKDASTTYNNKPFNDYCNKIAHNSREVFFVHIREVEEIEALKKWCEPMHGIEFISLKVERDSVTNRFTNNTGDVGATQPYDYTDTLLNDGTMADWITKSQDWFEKIATPIFGKPIAYAN